jgi:hypothetical protein
MLTFLTSKRDKMSSTIVPPEPTQYTPAATMPESSKEETFQEPIQEALAPVL